MGLFNLWLHTRRRYMMLSVIVSVILLVCILGILYILSLLKTSYFMANLSPSVWLLASRECDMSLIPRIRDAIRPNLFGMNPLRTSGDFIRHGTWAGLVQVKAHRLYGTNPQPQPLLTYSKLDVDEKKNKLKFEPKYQTLLQENACKMSAILLRPERLNKVRPRQNGRHFADDKFNPIFVNENVIISIRFSLKFVRQGPINNIPAFV